MPGVFYGRSLSFPEIVGNFAFGRHGVLGLPAGVIGNYLLAFFVFAGVLMATGAGESFLKIALAVAGQYRGGAAKVSVISSSLFGTLSESTTANIMADGPITIPAMKRTGFKPEFAAAVEACASGAGNLTPPVMGGIAFVICVMTGIDYATICLASLTPVILYYFSLFLVIDAHAVKNGLRGMPRESLPSFRQSLTRGWMFILVIAFMTFGLIYMRWEAKSALYSALLMMALCFIYRDTRITWAGLHQILVRIASLISTVFAIMLPVGLILVGLLTTGMPATVTAYVIGLGGESIPLVLFIGVAAAFVMGMAGLALTAYLFLAVTLLPTLINVGGINLTAAHLFVMYIVLYSGLTPPVAIAAFVAAGIAESDPMKTSVTSMRVGWTLFIVSFYLLFSPGLILQAPPLDIAWAIVTCTASIPLIVGGIEGYIAKVGILKTWMRPLMAIAGLLVGFPTTGWIAKICGVILFIVLTAVLKLSRSGRYVAPKPVPPPIPAAPPAQRRGGLNWFSRLVGKRTVIVGSLFGIGAVLLIAGLAAPAVPLVYPAVAVIILAIVLMRVLREKS
jgi:TRAP transporter 4TM/12TM fusion protein